MTKKHFIAIAADIRENLTMSERDESEVFGIESQARSLCDVFATFNPAFDRARFLAACGVEA
jgi:hypothetical protein